MKDYSKFWDAVYVINLDFRKDRWESIALMAKNAGLEIQRWNAVKATDIDLDKHRIGTRVKKQSCIACTLSHYGVYRDALSKGYRQILVLEDDAVIPIDLYEKLDQFFNKTGLTDFDLLYLGGADKYPSALISENLAVSQCTLLTHAMLFTRHGMQQVIDIVDEQDDGKCRMTIDVFLSEYIQPKNKAYQIVPWLITTIVSHSDIAGYKRNWDELLRTVKIQGQKNSKKWAFFEERAKNFKKIEQKQLF
jgi:GR25 family glycosyltransferase involved in LPS biosynthesis